MMKLVKLLTCMAVLVLATSSLAEESVSNMTPSVDQVTDSSNEDLISTSATEDPSVSSSLEDLTNDELVVKLNDINDMTSEQQRELLVEVSRRIVKDGPEPFIEGRRKAIAENSDIPLIEDETIEIASSEVRIISTEEYVRDPEKSNIKGRDSQKKPVPYGSAYND